MIMNTETMVKTPRSHSFFDLPRQAIIRESPSVRLQKAAIEGNLAAVKRLARKVPNIQNPNPENNYTTLMYAARYGHVELVEWLLQMGHEEEAISVDNEGITVLMIACIYNQEEIFYRYVSWYPECIHAISKNGWTALLYAAQNGNTTLVRYLLSISADIDHVDNDGNSALHHASAWGHTQVMELLVARGCNVNLENKDLFTAQDYAYSFAVQDHLKELGNMPVTDESALSMSSSYIKSSTLSNGRAHPLPSSSFLSNSALSGSVAISRGPSYGGYESPTPRASTSSSSILANGMPHSATSSNPHISHLLHNSSGNNAGPTTSYQPQA